MTTSTQAKSTDTAVSESYYASHGPDTSGYQVHTVDAYASPVENLAVVFAINQNLPQSPCFELWIPTNGYCEAEVRVTGEGQQHRIPLRNIPIRLFKRRAPTLAMTQPVSHGP